MTLKETIENVKKWSIANQLEFCDKITFNITIGIRSILSYENKSDSEKTEAIKWINEFHHRIHNLKFEIKQVVSSVDKIKRIGEHANYYASQNKIASGEIAAILKSSYESIIRKNEIEKPFKIPESIFELIKEDSFRKRTAMYIGEKNINLLKGFMDGYFYGLDSKEIHLRETEPKFKKFHDWVANYFNWYESTAGWKNIILKECGGDEKMAVDKFFELYDKFKNDK